MTDVIDRWLAIEDEHDPHTAHVIPIDDHVQHEDDGTECICGPTVEHLTANDGGDAWLVTHHSLDGREQTE